MITPASSTVQASFHGVSARTILSIVLCCLLSLPQWALAEGTKQTMATSSDLAHLLMNFNEYDDFGRYNGTQFQRLFIHIEDPENERVYFGFSQFYDDFLWPNVGSPRTGYFRIKDPAGNVVWPTPGNPAGFMNNAAISNWAEAVAGPNQIVGSGGYNALEFDPSGLPAGDYYIEFSASQSTYSSDDLVIPYYDITVATEGLNPSAIDGRVYSYKWAFGTPSVSFIDPFDRDFTADLFVYSDDGFVTNVDFSNAGFRGAAFNLAFNSRGTGSTGVFETDRASVEDGGSHAFAEYRIFLNDPDSTAFPNGTFGEFVADADFPKLYGCPDDSQWFFRFSATEPGLVEILVDADGDFDYDPGTADLLFSLEVIPYPGESPPYQRDIPWDGLDGLGVPIPTNSTLSIEYSYSQGFYHLPVFDVEYMLNGFEVTGVRPATPQPYNPEFFYDDEDITESLPGGQPELELNGCTPPCHYWDDINYGNNNTINTFWFAYRSETQVVVPFETPPPTCAGCPFTPYEITGTLFHDADQGGTQNGAEQGFAGVTINLYEDANDNGQYDPGTDPLLDSDDTDANGDYFLVGQVATSHLVRVDQLDLPVNATLTTAGQINVEFFSLFDASCDNDFGFVAYPIAVTDRDTVQDQSIPIFTNVLLNDIDPIGDGVTTTIITPPVHGTAVLANNDSVEYTALADFIGQDSLQYEICSPEGLCDTAWVIYQIGDICGDGIDNDGDGFIDNYSPAIVIVASGTDPYCFGFSDGSVSGSATGGRAPYVYTWYESGTPIGSTQTITDLDAGTYVLEVEDENGCKEQEAVVLNDNNCPPVANNDIHNTLVDVPVSGNVLTNDWDMNGDAISANPTPLSGPSNGSVVLNPDGSFTYTPNAGFDGEDVFTYQVCDSGLPSLCDTASVYIEVVPITSGNEPPIANADAAQTMQDVPVSGNVLNNDGDPDGDNIILNTTPLSGPSNGSVVVQSNGDFTYTPTLGFLGTDTFRYEICDDAVPSLCDQTIVVITVLPDSGPENDPPFAGDDAALTPQEIPVSGNLLANDFDPNGDNIAISLTPVSDPTNGTVIISGNGDYTYTPSVGFIGSDQFVYQICDDGVPSLCAQATCYITVYPDNSPPVAVNDINATLVDVPVSGNVSTNDWDPDEDDLSVTVLPVSGPSNGSVTLLSDGSYTYTPDPGYEGEDSFTYETCDNGLPSLCDTATVTIQVVPITSGNEPPVAQDDAAQTQVDVPVVSNVLVNDDDPDGDNIILNLTPLTGPFNGSVSLLGDGTFTYTPNPGFEGTDMFTYRICDDQIPSLCDEALVTIDVLPDFGGDNDPPFAGDDAALTPEEVPVSGQLLTNDYDVNGDDIDIDTNPISGPSNGSVVIAANGVYTYTPDPGFLGTDQFVYEICDDGVPSLCAHATCYITVYPGNNPPVAVNDINNTLVNTPVSGSVATNDYDPDGDNLTVETPAFGSPSNGSLSLLPNGSYTYTPNPGFVGDDTFTYVVCDDGIPQLCDTAVVTIAVIPVTVDNDPPVANPDAYVTLEDVPVIGNVLVNDDDPDNDPLVLTVPPLTLPASGSVTLLPDGSFLYAPDPGFTGEDTFIYEVCDNAVPSLCDTALVTIKVLPDHGPENDPPFAGDDAALTPMDVPVSGILISNDFDPNGDNIQINTTAISGPSNGAVVINPDGSYTYTPNAGYIGPDQFVYGICDDGAPSLCAQATCYITVYAGPSISYTITEPLCNGESTGSIDITVSNAAEPVTYSWSNGATTEDLNNVPAGTYVVTVTDNAGSVVQETIELTEPDVLGVVVDVQDETIVNGCNGTATANPTGGTPPYTYLWSDGQTTQTASGLCAGIYQVTVTDANGCEVTTSNVINPPSCDLDVLVTGTHVDCNGGSNGTVMATPVTAQSNTPFAYLWNTGDTTQQVIGLTAGPYSVTVTDSIGCTASGSFVVTEPPLLTVNAIAVDEQTFNGCDGAASAAASGGTAPYLYEWSPGQFPPNDTITNLCPGNYTVTVTDANGCMVQTTVTVNELQCAGFSVAVNTYGLSCFGANDGAAVAVVSGGTPPFTYFWPTGGASTDSIGALGAGDYTVIVTDDVNCEQTVTGTVTQPALLEATTAVDPVTCHGLDNGTIELTVTGGTTPYTFSWSNGATTEDLVNLGPGTYGVVVTDTNNCTVSTSGAVTEPDTLDANSIDVDVTCFGGSDGSIDLTVTGGLAPHLYTWSHGATSEDVFGLSAGPYTVTIGDQNGCTYEYSTSIGESSLFVPTITADGPTTFCNGESVNLTATAGSSYLWSTGDTTQSINVVSTGVYTVHVVTADGCEGDSDPVQVTVNPLPEPTVSPVGPTTFCDGGSVTLTTGSFATYLWSTGDTTQSIVVTASGNYTVTVTDANGCAATSAPLAVTVNDLPDPVVNPDGPTTFCEGGSVVLGTGPAASYLWSNGETTQTITVTSSGSFTVLVTDTNGCQAMSDPVAVTVHDNPIPIITPDGPVEFCEGDSVTLTSSLAVSYLWSTGATTQSITVTSAGTYTVTVTDTNGCMGTSAPITVTVNSNPEPTVTAGGPLEFCVGDSVQLTASGASGYLWSTGETTQSIQATTSGSYWVTVTDINGCLANSDTIDVIVNPLPTPTITPDGPTEFCDGEDVVLSVSGSGTYLWNSGQTSQSITVNTSGTFWATVTNGNGCSGISDTVDVIVNPNPTPIVTPDGPTEFCQGLDVTLTASAEASYLWNTGETTQSITADTTGVYFVTVTDTNGCSGTSAPVTVVVNTLPDPDIFAIGDTVFCEGDSVLLGTRPAESYLWSNGDTTRVITVFTSGTYTVTVTDQNGCQGISAPITVQVNPNPSTTISASGPLEFCQGESVVLTADAPSSITLLSFAWNTSEATQSITVTGSGSYWATVTDENGCSANTDTLDVTVWPLPEPEVSVVGTPSFCVGDTVFLTSTPAVSYDWSPNGETTQVIVADTSGIYTVTVTDTNGCLGVSPPAIVDINANPNPTITPNGIVEICEDSVVTLTAATAASYLWNTGDTTQTIQVSTSGTYNVTATDSSGCSGTSADVIVIVHPNPTPTVVPDDTLDFCVGGTVNLSTQTFDSYMWSPTGAVAQSIQVTASGTFYVTVTDTNGCAGISDTVDVTVFEPPVVTVDVVGPTQFCFGESATLIASAGISYLWSNGATTQSIEVFTSGSYTVQVTDENGCVGESQPVTIQVFALPNAGIIADGPTEFCIGESVTLTATGGQNYVWSTGSTTNSILVTESGTYWVIADNQFGCVDTSSSITVVVNDPPTVAIFPDGPTTFCEGDSVGLVASGAATYLWSTGETGPMITVHTNGSYSVVGTDTHGCVNETGSVQVTVYQNPIPTITADGPGQFCEGDTLVLTSSFASSYLWSTGETTRSIVVTMDGSYTVTVTDEVGCEGTSAPFVVTVFDNPLPTVTLSGPAEVCEGDTVTLTASGSVSYLWNTGDTTQSIQVDTSGIYWVEIVDQNGCSGVSDPDTVMVYPNPEPEITADGDTVICQGESVLLTSSPAESYQWNTGATVQQIAAVVSGTYMVQVTDTNGCQGVASIDIVVNPTPTPPPVITPNGPTTFCDGDSVNLEVDEWESYLWSTGATTQDIWVSESGFYTVTVTNEYGCEGDAAGVTVTVNPNPEAIITATSNGDLCEGESLILATDVFVTYAWNTGDSTQSIEVDSAGSYTVTVWNSFGCADTSDVFDVTQNPTPEVSIEADGPTTICPGGELALSAFGDEPFLWSTGETAQTIVVSEAGEYFVQTTDTVTGCVGVSDTVVVSEFPEFDTEIVASGPTAFCEGDEVTLSISSGTVVNWSTGETSQSITVSDLGIYFVTAVDSNGCEGTAAQTVTVFPTPIAQIIPGAPIPYCEGDTVVLTALFNLGATYAWNNGDTALATTVTESGIYLVTVTSPFGCVDQDVLPVLFLPSPTAEIEVIGQTSICEGDEVTLVASGGPPVGTDYGWNTGETGSEITVGEAGTYSVVVTNPLGCSDDASVDIEVVPGPVAYAGSDTTVCVGDSLWFTASGGDNFVWTPGGTEPTIAIEAVEDGMYILEVTNDGCEQVAYDTVWVFVQDYPNAAFGHGTTHLGEPVVFTDSSTVQPLYSWDWDFGDGNFSDEQHPEHNYEGPGEYTVTLVVGTSAGCTDTVSAVLPVEEFFRITNVLTPNDDDINDHVWITSSLADVIEAKVYNRWGLSVWEAVGTDLRFRGKTSEGVELPAGTYYYVISLDYGDAGVSKLTGYITLIR